MNDQTVSTANAEHYTWSKECDGWFLVRTPGLHVIEERMPPGAAERAHHHERARQFFYVLEGELTLVLAGTTVAIRKREGLEIAPGTVHQAVNRADEPARFLVISQPASHGDRVDA